MPRLLALQDCNQNGIDDSLEGQSGLYQLDRPRTKGWYIFDTGVPELRWEPILGPHEILIPSTDPRISTAVGVVVFTFTNFQTACGVEAIALGSAPLRILAAEVIRINGTIIGEAGGRAVGTVEVVRPGAFLAAQPAAGRRLEN